MSRDEEKGTISIRLRVGRKAVVTDEHGNELEVISGPSWGFSIGYDGTVHEYTDGVKTEVTDPDRKAELAGGFPAWTWDETDAELPAERWRVAEKRADLERQVVEKAEGHE